MALVDDLLSTEDRFSMADPVVSMGLVVEGLRLLPFGPAIDQIQQCRSMLAAVEAEHVAQRSKAGFSARATQGVLQSTGKVSKSEAARATRRADAVAVNPSLATEMASGALSAEHVDAIADASTKTGGVAAKDRRLLNRVKASNPDQARQVAANYVDNHRDAAAVEAEYDRQHRLRCAKTYQTRAGTNVLHIEGPRAGIDQIWAAVTSQADRLYRDDGGRDTAEDDHPRTREQRRYDAAIGLLTTTPASSRSSSSSNRPALVATIDVTTLAATTNTTPDALTGHLIGTGPIPATVVEALACRSDWIGLIFGQDGDILWQGRRVRHPTPAQMTALITRDQGCTICRAHHSQCEAHHLVPWNAPGRGQTNIDGLALVCTACHHRIHNNNQTLHYNQQTNTWNLRTATPNETPPPPRTRPPDTS